MTLGASACVCILLAYVHFGHKDTIVIYARRAHKKLKARRNR